MTETTDTEMNAICAFCGELKCNCTCGRTAGGSFRIVHYKGRKMKTIYEKEADILDASFIFCIAVFFTTILVLW